MLFRSGEVFEERFTEYSYTAQQVCDVCEKAGLTVLDVRDGERFCALRPDSQRMIFVTKKRYTQLGDGAAVPPDTGE